MADACPNGNEARHGCGRKGKKDEKTKTDVQVGGREGKGQGGEERAPSSESQGRQRRMRPSATSAHAHVATTAADGERR